MRKFNIALDGPSGAGKSTAADLLAERYQLHHLDTGSMYRAIAYGLHQQNVKPDSPELQQALDTMNLQVSEDGIILNGRDVSAVIRTPEVSRLASQYSALEAVRNRLVSMQQAIAAEKGYILDGRDICDVVLPDAEVKIYLDASAQARAKRRWLQDQQQGKSVSYEQVYADIQARDLQDSTREISPLKISREAVVIDSSDLSLEQTVDAMAQAVEDALKARGCNS